MHSNKQTPLLFPQQGDCNLVMIKCRALSCRAILQRPSETQLVWLLLEMLISCMCLWQCESATILTGLSTVAFNKWIDELI